MLVVLLGIALAHADPASDATRVLSRYPAGSMPADDVVLASLATLSDEGRFEHVSLLRSIIKHESNAVGGAANAALDNVVVRHRDDRRHKFADSVPSPTVINGWIDTDRARSNDHAGRTLGRAELEALAYARLIVGQGIDTEPPPAKPDKLLSRGSRAELDGDLEEALVFYARAAAGGEDQALEIIREFGVDPERLLLGMTSSGWPVDSPVSATAIEVLIREGSTTTIAVLAERAKKGHVTEQVVALDALGRMLGQRELPPNARSVAMDRLRAAKGDSRQIVRETAVAALGEAPVQ